MVVWCNMPLSSFPVGIDVFDTILPETLMDQDGTVNDHHEIHNKLAESVTNVQSKIGVIGSEDSDSVMYKVERLLSDLSIINPLPGEYLLYNGSNWINTPTLFIGELITGGGGGGGGDQSSYNFDFSSYVAESSSNFSF